MNVQASLDNLMMERAPKPQVRSNESVDGKRFGDIINDKNLSSPRVSDHESRVENKAAEPEKENKEKIWTKVNQGQKEVKKDSKPATQRAAMQIFLQKMESEVGVDQEQVLQAFAELSVNELVSPPEESAPILIDKLNLDEEKEGKALALYNEMLAMTAAASMSNYLNNSGQNARLEVMNKREAQLRQLHQSLDKMNQQFFLNGAEGEAIRMKSMQAAQAKAHAVYASQQAPGEQTSEQTIPVAMDMNMAAGQSQNLNGQQVNFGEMLKPTGNVGVEVPATDKELEAELAKIVEELGGESELPPELKKMVEESGLQIGGEAATENEVAQTVLPKVDAGLIAGETLENSVAPSLDEAGLDFAFGEPGSDDREMDTELAEGEGFRLELSSVRDGKKPEFTVPSEKVLAADVQNNVKEIITKAQFLVRQGGGEMKIALSPEGLGNVNLRVVSENGQVHVEMVASNDEAKKLLEKGLLELRDNLAQHKLSLESIKIDASKELSNQLAEQQQNLEQNAQQRFLHDFRERNFAMRREFFEFGSPRTPSSQTRDEAMNQNPSASKRRAERRLDLVA